MEAALDSRTLRRNFVAGLLSGLRVVWPILSLLLGLIVSMLGGVYVLQKYVKLWERQRQAS